MFTEELIKSIAADCNVPTDNEMLDTMFIKYNEASPRDDSPVYYRFLYKFAQQFPGLTMLELGCKYGSASMHFLKGGGAEVIAVDCTKQVDLDLFSKEVPGRFTFVESMSTSYSLIASVMDEKPDILFIDTDHAYETTAAEFALWQPAVKKGGLIFFDDICAPEYGCTKFWQALPGRKITFPELHPSSWGFGVYFND